MRALGLKSFPHIEETHSFVNKKAGWPSMTKSRMAIYDERNNHRYWLQPLPLRRTPTRRHRSSRIVTSVVTGGGRGTKSSWGFSFCFPLSFSAWIFLALAFLTFSA
ncbi:hypothetical protein glysoja_037129 [Glycine soja]|uniref:Uncharacterized protein n=1 Tax=Glycine soja TaxID=3848 RepID=A0A0B2QYT4_GLYSO|nr:hypothetical protein glysoja_037129 [Glycine soja]